MKNCISFLFFILSILYAIANSHTVLAQSQSLSVTPPLFQLSIEPGDIWQSSVRVINPNDYPLTVYAEVVNFAPEGEGGQGKFIPLIHNDDTRATMASWIEIPSGPHIIEGGQSKEISFFIDTPRDAAPGGHFAAILIGTEPPKETSGSLALITTQTVASLFFTRIEGDVIESADIREFTTLDRSVEVPEAEFSLRFENKGNVHVQPKGNIIITNMWGTERGIIPVNHETHFGNVLPTSIRNFHFSWKGELSLADIGRYKAIATLTYGEDGNKNVTATTYFWIIPIKGVAITVISVVFFVFSISWMIRLYVRRMLALAGVQPGTERFSHTQEQMSRNAEYEASHVRQRVHVSAPLREGTLDLRARLRDAEETADMLKTILSFIVQYKKFFIALVIIVAAFIALYFYIGQVKTTETNYEVTVVQDGVTRVMTDDEVEKVQN